MSKHYVGLTDVWYRTLPEIQAITGDLTNDYFEWAIENASKRSIYTTRDELIRDYNSRGVNSILYNELKALHRTELLKMYRQHKMLDYLSAYFMNTNEYREYYYFDKLNDLLVKHFGFDLDIRYAGL